MGQKLNINVVTLSDYRFTVDQPIEYCYKKKNAGEWTTNTTVSFVNYQRFGLLQFTRYTYRIALTTGWLTFSMDIHVKQNTTNKLQH